MWHVDQVVQNIMMKKSFIFTIHENQDFGPMGCHVGVASSAIETKRLTECSITRLFVAAG